MTSEELKDALALFHANRDQNDAAYRDAEARMTDALDKLTDLLAPPSAHTDA